MGVHTSRRRCLKGLLRQLPNKLRFEWWHRFLVENIWRGQIWIFVFFFLIHLCPLSSFQYFISQSSTFLFSSSLQIPLFICTWRLRGNIYILELWEATILQCYWLTCCSVKYIHSGYLASVHTWNKTKENILSNNVRKWRVIYRNHDPTTRRDPHGVNAYSWPSATFKITSWRNWQETKLLKTQVTAFSGLSAEYFFHFFNTIYIYYFRRIILLSITPILIFQNSPTILWYCRQVKMN